MLAFFLLSFVLNINAGINLLTEERRSGKIVYMGFLKNRRLPFSKLAYRENKKIKEIEILYEIYLKEIYSTLQLFERRGYKLYIRYNLVRTLLARFCLKVK